jgi:hypothetical protein
MSRDRGGAEQRVASYWVPATRTGNSRTVLISSSPRTQSVQTDKRPLPRSKVYEKNQFRLVPASGTSIRLSFLRTEPKAPEIAQRR